MPILNSEAPELDVKDWINSEISIDEGTYLLDFWRYTSVNCVRMIPMMKEIDRAYEDLEVVGIHSPRFEFEDERENVERAAEKHGIDYTVALDRDNSTWESYGNRYWPRHALVHDGRLVWQHVGESSLEGLKNQLSDILGVDHGPDMSHDPHEDGTPPAHLGFRNARGVNEEGVFRGEKELEVPDYRRGEELYLDGEWRMDDEFIEARGGSRLFFGFEGPEVYLVAHPAGGIRDVEVRLDGSTVDRKDAGSDLRVEDGRSFVRIKEPGLYSLVSTDMRRAELELRAEEKTRLFTLSFR